MKVLIAILMSASTLAGTCDKPLPDFWADAADHTANIRKELLQAEKQIGLAPGTTKRAADSSLALCKAKALKDFQGGNGGGLTISHCEARLLCSHLAELK